MPHLFRLLAALKYHSSTCYICNVEYFSLFDLQFFFWIFFSLKKNTCFRAKYRRKGTTWMRTHSSNVKNGKIILSRQGLKGANYLCFTSKLSVICMHISIDSLLNLNRTLIEMKVRQKQKQKKRNRKKCDNHRAVTCWQLAKNTVSRWMKSLHS